MFIDGLLMWASRLATLTVLIAGCMAGACCVAYAANGGESATDVYVSFGASDAGEQPLDTMSDDDGRQSGSASHGKEPKGKPGNAASRGDGPADRMPSISQSASDDGEGADNPGGGAGGKSGKAPGEKRKSGAASDQAPVASGKQSVEALPKTGDAVLTTCLVWVTVSAVALAAALLFRRKQGERQ